MDQGEGQMAEGRPWGLDLRKRGYMFHEKVEIVVGWDSLDADNFANSTDRTSVGLNWYLNKHKAKLQTTFRSWENINGVSGADPDELIAQFQFVF